MAVSKKAREQHEPFVGPTTILSLTLASVSPQKMSSHRSISSFLPRFRYASTIAFGRRVAELDAKAIRELPTHELLQRLGYIRQDHAGLVHWLPLGLRTLRNIETIIGKRMTECGSLEVALSSISGSELWKKTGRWGNEELFKLKGDFCLVPTCEEEITRLVNDAVSSYKELPLVVHQITRKYRDEKRPRAGLLRGREFLMKDAYSFDSDEAGGLATFERLNSAYRAIFTDLRVPFVAANADSGDIGGDLSTEWHYRHSSGEDVLFECSGCGSVSNSEKATSVPAETEPAARRAKAAYFTTQSRDKLVVMYYPEDRVLNPQFARSEIPDLDLSLRDEAAVLEIFEDEDAFLSKWIVRIMDPRVTRETDLPDLKVPYHRNAMSTFLDVPLVEAREGEVCGSCFEGTLSASRAIEVGHTFYLDEKYSSALGAGFTDESGAFTPFKMGCYGIGVSRLVAAIAEVLRDSQGLRWPATVAPYKVGIVPGSGADEEVITKAKTQLEEAGFSVLEDSRPKVSVGKRLRENKCLGLPLQIIIGKLYPLVEIEVRGQRFGTTSEEAQRSGKWNWEVVSSDVGEKHLVHVDDLVEVVGVLLKDL
ncbi:unnamed protein product [Kuraishia capsulata CBS 1993]|uniref:proline--tRNA ligase n=1 Tax=Kuraishia capsulata CBS 1993 TaxID=1382522 RepID=W6MHF9_9ASCO|nr:uncharacterized protein KUCA_T00001075001 [Kuraishia capsulata CBS 1993]CDK25108.1 unnamed protein product [Kuraishia capsulata CBS 1993]